MTRRLTLTKAIVYAAAWDAAERSRRKRNLPRWDDAACEAYQVEFDRLAGTPEHWMDLPAE